MNRLTKTLLAAALVMPASAAAQSIVEVPIHDGDHAGLLWNNGPRNNDQRGAGAEHTAVADLVNAAGGRVLMATATASYTDVPGSPVQDRIQGLCVSYKVDPMMGLIKGPARYFTDNRGDEYQNAHRMTMTPVLGGTAALVTYGYDPDNNTRLYGMVLNPDCSTAADQTLLLAKNNDNIGGAGSSTAAVTFDSPTETRAVECPIGNGNGTDDGWCLGITITKDAAGKVTVKRAWDISVESQEERTRMYVVPTAIPEHVFYCDAAGNSQPPQIGIRCGLVNAAPGVPNNQRLVWRKLVAQREGNIYRSTPNVSVMLDAAGKPTNKMVIGYVEVDTRNRNGRNKGRTTIMHMTAEVTPDTLNVLAPAAPGMVSFGDQAHPSSCQGQFGPNGDPAAFVMQGSIVDTTTGVGRISVVRFDQATNKINREKEVTYSNSTGMGYISQYYGNNPNTPQGRNHQTCQMFHNPGYGVVGGFQPTVKDFLVVSNTGRKLRTDGSVQDKSAWSLILVPAVVPNTTTPDPTPDPMPDPDPQPQPDPTAPDPGSTFGGCSTGGSSSGAMVLVLGAAVAVIRRRRSH